jgi:hypothetical protein
MTEQRQLPQRTAGPLLHRAQRVFQERGQLGRKLSLVHEGSLYRISCDERAFSVYRVNQDHRLRCGAPGWLVCLVDSETIFEEARTPLGDSDPWVCRLGADDWMELAGRALTSPPATRP